jgi:TrmH family RNA methyltransferase
MSDVITSLQNERVKLAYSLQNRPRARRKEKKIALEGTRLIADALLRQAKPDFVLYEPATADYELVAQLQETKTKLLPVSTEVLQHICDTQQPQGMVGVFPMPFPTLLKNPASILILDAIREPGNMGTILRTAGASGIQVVLLSPDCVDPYNPKVVRSGMGAHFRVPILELQWFEIAQYTEKMRVYIADGSGTLAYTQADFTQPHAIVIGNEAHGANNAKKLGEVTAISIPMSAQTESLNAAIATGVIVFEAQRQRLLMPSS